MKILFISRAYPPVIGGIENQNYELSRWLSKVAEVKTIANTHGKLFLPLFIPYVIAKALFLLRKFDAVLLGDGVLAPVGWKLKLFSKKPMICVVHGLDLTYKNWVYQKFWVGGALKKMDKLIAVGNETLRIAVKKGIQSERLVFIPNGIDTQKFGDNFSRTQLKKILNIYTENTKFLLTSGRQVKRKGSAWFIRKVLPLLPENVFYVLAGDGPDRKNILLAAKDVGLESRIKILGKVTDEVRNALMHTCDVFIQPNIKISGDIEGFGISVIEAAYCKIPVLASRLEGLQDAIKDGQNGFLLESGNAVAWKDKILELLNNEPFCREFGEKASQFIAENYSWEKISKNYLEEIKKAVKTEA